MQKVKEIFSGGHDDKHTTSTNRDSLSGSGTSTQAYDTTGALGSSDRNSSSLTGDRTSGLTGDRTSGLTGDRNVHSGSTGLGSNIGRDNDGISGGRGLGNAATGAGTTGTRSGYGDEGLSGDRYTEGRHSGSTGSHVVDKLTGNHSIGHDSRDTSRFDPAAETTTHDHKHLQSVVHNTVRHSEVEEVERQRNVDRHVHHLQHHVQPVVDKQVKDEVIHQNFVPETHIREKHVNTADDVKLFASLGEKHRDTEQHMPKERTIVDLGEKVNTTTHHHVHHVTQPVIEREVHDRHRIHTTIPLSHTVHEAPIIHKSSVHEPVAISDFLKGGGKLDSGISHDRAGILSTGDCDREVDGVGERMVKDLNLNPSTFGHSGTSSTTSGLGSATGSHQSGLGSATGSHHQSGLGSSGLTDTSNSGIHGSNTHGTQALRDEGRTGGLTGNNSGLTGNNTSSLGSNSHNINTPSSGNRTEL